MQGFRKAKYGLSEQIIHTYGNQILLLRRYVSLLCSEPADRYLIKIGLYLLKVQATYYVSAEIRLARPQLLDGTPRSVAHLATLCAISPCLNVRPVKQTLRDCCRYSYFIGRAAAAFFTQSFHALYSIRHRNCKPRLYRQIENTIPSLFLYLTYILQQCAQICHYTVVQSADRILPDGHGRTVHFLPCQYVQRDSRRSALNGPKTPFHVCPSFQILTCCHILSAAGQARRRSLRLREILMRPGGGRHCL